MQKRNRESAMRRIDLRDSRQRIKLAAVVFIVLIALGMVIPSGYVVASAGPAINVNSSVENKEVVEIKKAQTYPSDTRLLMTTVAAQGTADRGVLGAQAWYALLRKNKQLLPVAVMYPQNLNADEYKEQNKELMEFSQDSAALIAFELAGYKVSMQIKVVGVDPNNPSGKVLKEGDIIKGMKIFPQDSYYELKTQNELSTVIDRVPPNTTLYFQIVRDGKEQEVQFETIPYKKDATGWVHPGSLLGVSIEAINVKIPATVEYLLKDIGGPSAGNMFALAIYDKLTKGSLGGGHTIAGTGTVAWDGDVGPIGGITHKMRGAAAEGARDFLAPALNCAETIGYEPPGMRVWAIRNTQESILAVAEIAQGNTEKLTSCRDLVKKQQQALP